MTKKNDKADGARVPCDYPLWCIDRGPGFGEERFSGPFEGEGCADGALRSESDPEPASAVVRRCRRVKPSELVAAGLVLDAMREAAVEHQMAGAWADERHEETVNEARPGVLRDALSRYADDLFTTNIYVCEGDE